MPEGDIILLRLFFAVIAGGIIGAEREYRSKSAGFRTMILICVGSFLFTVFSKSIGNGFSPDRIASNIVTGIGFLGAGVIFKSNNRVNGITTAATIWAVAAIGMGIADGEYLLVAVSIAIIMLALYFLNKLELVIDRLNQSHIYRIVSVYREDLLKEYEQIMKSCRLRYKRIKRTRQGNDIVGTWIVQGAEKNHNEFTLRILHHTSVKEFDF